MINNTTEFLKEIKGFTLLEMISAMLVIGLMAVTAGPQIVESIQNFKVNAATGKMLSDIRYARELALSRHSTYGIEIDAANNLYKIFLLNGVNKTVINDPQRQQNMSFDFDLLPEYSGVTIGTVDLCEAGGCPVTDLRFNSFGAPLDSSGTAMASAATIPLSLGGVTRTVRINQQTAFCEAV